MATTIRLRRDTSENWTANNPILALGEPGVETDTKKMKIGNGVNDWRNLSYVEYPLPVATNTAFGTVKPDGTTITVNGGVLTAIGGSGGGGGGGGSGTVNSGSAGCLAFYPSAGTVVDDAQGLLWNSLTSVFTVNGTLNATNISGSLNSSSLTGTIPSTVLPTSTTSALGAVKVDGTSIIINNGTISSVLPIATNTTLGGVKVDGTTVIINDGVITAVGGGGGGGGSGTVNAGVASRLAYYPSSTNVVDDITDVTWNNLTNILSINGTLSATTITGSIAASNITGTLASTVLPTATTSALGAVKVDGISIIISSGIITAVPPTSISGNAGTVTNGVYTTGSYADPSWITSLSGSKVTNAVLTNQTYANPSWITNLDGSKILNGVLVTGSYVNPSWIVSLSGTKLTGTVVATNGVVTTGTYANPSWITSLDGNKVTNAVLNTGSYADPSWITSLSGSKITGELSSTTLPVATTSFLGGVKVDGITITIDGNGVISSVGGGYILPTAGTGSGGVLGGVKVDGVTITITDGVISAGGDVQGSLFADDSTLIVDAINKNIYGNVISATEFISTSVGSPVIESATDITLQAATVVKVQGAPFRLPSLTTTERNALIAVNGDMIYNSTLNKFQGYENGAWVNLI